MRPDRCTSLAALLSVLWTAVAGTALAQQPPSPAGAMPGASTTMAPGAAVSQPMILTDAQVKGFLDAMDELRDLGAAARTGPAADPSRPEVFARALQLADASPSVLKKHGFADTAEFQRVAYNAAMAYGALQRGGAAGMRQDLDRARANQARAMERMQQHLTPEQQQAIAARMKAGMASASAMREVPQQNVELMKRYQDRMAALRGGRR
jgi:hypothetical protein